MHIIIFSRSASRRLKNKALIKLSNHRTLLDQVIFLSSFIVPKSRIVLATTTNKIDDKLCNIASAQKIKYFRGSEDDVIGRTINCCENFGINHFLRFCGDRPIVDILKIKKEIQNLPKYFDLVTTNNTNKKIDPGFTIEIIKYKTLKKIYKKGLSKKQKEHITKFIYENYKLFNIKHISANQSFYKGYDYTLNNKSDISKINYLLNYYNHRKISDIVGAYEKYSKKN